MRRKRSRLKHLLEQEPDERLDTGSMLESVRDRGGLEREPEDRDTESRPLPGDRDRYGDDR